MNRKLHNSMLAFSATGLMLLFGLMAASPVQTDQDATAPAALATAPAPMDAFGQDAAGQAATRAEAAEVQARRIESRVRQLEAGLDKSASLGDTIASAVAFAASVSTEAALNAAIEATDDEAEQQRAADNEQRRHARKVRGALAVPYFSFAQGLRRGSRS
jgi:hypothetical protein